MTKPAPAYTDRQLKTFDVLERNRMAWAMLRFLLVVFGVILCALIAGVFFVETENWIKVTFAFFDGVVGWSIKYIVAYLFPSNQLSPPQTSSSS